MKGRDFTSDKYRYGFNGKEKDDEVKGGGNSYDFGARIYDSRLGRWLSLDPLAHKFIGWSPYCGVNDNPIIYIDPTGKGAEVTITVKKVGDKNIYTIDMKATIYLYPNEASGVTKEKIEEHLKAMNIPLEPMEIEEEYYTQIKDVKVYINIALDIKIISEKEAKDLAKKSDANVNFFEVLDNLPLLEISPGQTVERRGTTVIPKGKGTQGLNIAALDLKKFTNETIQEEWWHTIAGNNYLANESPAEMSHALGKSFLRGDEFSTEDYVALFEANTPQKVNNDRNRYIQKYLATDMPVPTENPKTRVIGGSAERTITSEEIKYGNK